MALAKRAVRLVGRGSVLALLTLAISGLFKVAAFAREAFIASHFGLSSVTDAYFAFQQFPTLLTSFMFGAFVLAFAPAFASAKWDSQKISWFPGLLFYASALGIVLNLLSLFASPWLLRAFTGTVSPLGAANVVILSCSFCPVIWLGIWSATKVAGGHNVAAMFVGGLPYLLMTILLIVLFKAGKLSDLSLPWSFFAGFACVGLFALLAVVVNECRGLTASAVLMPWKVLEFRRFVRQLTASSAENLGFSANQLLLTFFMAKAGTGAVSANVCAMRVGMLGFTLLGQPLAQLVQAKLCSASENERSSVFKKWLAAVGIALVAFALVVLIGREPITSLVYLRGKFSSVELGRVIEIVPAWLAYFVVSSANAMMARYLFVIGCGGSYVRRQLAAYLFANLLRFSFWGRLSPSELIWCSVCMEGIAFLVSLRSSFASPQRVAEPEVLEVQEV